MKIYERYLFLTYLMTGITFAIRRPNSVNFYSVIDSVLLKFSLLLLMFKFNTNYLWMEFAPYRFFVSCTLWFMRFSYIVSLLKLIDTLVTSERYVIFITKVSTYTKWAMRYLIKPPMPSPGRSKSKKVRESKDFKNF